MKKIAFSTLLFVLTMTLHAQGIIPQPASLTPQAGKGFEVTPQTTIAYPENDNEMGRNARFLAQYIEDFTSLKLATSTYKKKPEKGQISLSLDKKLAQQNREAYRIDIRESGISIAGASHEAVFRAIQTLRKLLPLQANGSQFTFNCTLIEDAPEFTYRGMHLDCARHFFSVDFVKQYIDMMALHGMNRFHWHLTDDQGWRVEIKQFPRLTEISSTRAQTVLGRNSDVLDGVPHGGYYTQQELRDIVAYAAERYIEIIPEIDMPGHMLAVLAAYPELGCHGQGYEVCPYWGISDEILCAGNPHTYRFVEAVLDEVCSIFPYEYIHIGGDEAPKRRWKECPKCQQKIADEALYATKDQPAEELLQGYFTTQVQQYLTGKGKKIIGWDELLGCDVDQSATIMSWRGGNNTLNAARKGHDVIVVPNASLYFDFYQTPEQWNEPMLIGGCSTVENVFNLHLVPDEATSEERQHILGFQANLWTEYIASPSLAEYQVLPRMAALAELQWNYSRRGSYSDFLDRLNTFRRIYDHYGWHYARHLWPDEHRQVAKTFG